MTSTEHDWLLKPPSSKQTQESRRIRYNEISLSGVPDGFMDSDSDDDPYSMFMSESEWSDDDEAYVAPVREVRNAMEIPEKPVILLNALRCAIQSGTLDKVKIEFEGMKGKGFEVHHQLDGSWNAMMFACLAVRPDVLRFLMEEGADLKWKTTDSLNGLHALACGTKSNCETWRKYHLLESTLNRTKEEGRKSKKAGFMEAAKSYVYQLFGTESKEEEEAEEVDTKVYEDDVEKKDVLEVANMLLKGGINVNLRERELAATPLHLAVKNKAADLIEWLLENNADVNATDSSLNTPLGWAAERGYGPIAKILLQHKADAEIININGLTAYEIAGFKGFKHVAKSIWLYQTGAVTSVNNLPGLNDYETECTDREVTEFSNSAKQINSILIDAKQRKHIPKFRNMTLHQFLLLDHMDLEVLGVKAMSERLRIMDMIRRVHICDWKPGSLPRYTFNYTVKATDVLNACQLIIFKLNVMRSTVKYMTTCAAVPKNCQSLTNPGLEATQLERILSYCKKLQSGIDELKSAAELFVDSIEIAELTIDLKIGDLIR